MYEKMQDSGLTEIKPLMCILAISGQHSVLSCPKSPQGSLCGLLLWLVGCDILCLLKWQAEFFIHNLQFKLHWHSAFLFVKSGNHNGEHSPSPIPLWFVGWFLLIKLIYLTVWGFPGGAHAKEPACQCRRHKRRGFDPWVGKIARS